MPITSGPPGCSFASGRPPRRSTGSRRLSSASPPRRARPGCTTRTITWAYLLLINERMERGGRGRGWNEFAASNPDLLVWRPGVLDEYYTPETLESDLARRVFVLPDR
jgi:hypothetical protein